MAPQSSQPSHHPAYPPDPSLAAPQAAAPTRPLPAHPAARPWPSAQPRIVVDRPSEIFESTPPHEHAFDIPDTECDGWSTEHFTLRSASVRGDKHRYYRQPRQDAARAAVHKATGAVVFAVADGVSAAVHAERGANEACRASVEMLLHLVGRAGDAGGDGSRIDFQAVAHHAADRLYEVARWRIGSERKPEHSDVAGMFATTLVAGVLWPRPDGTFVELFRIGDSCAWVLDNSLSRYGELFKSKTGGGDDEFVTNEVDPLPKVPERLEAKSGLLRGEHVLLVGTDGFGEPLGDGDGLIGSLFAGQLAVPPPPLWFAHVLDFSRETFDDDRTLLAVWTRPSGERR